MVSDRRLSVDGQKFPVTPDALGTFLNFFAGNDGFDLIVVIIHFERPEAILADVKGLGFV